MEKSEKMTSGPNAFMMFFRCTGMKPPLKARQSRTLYFCPALFKSRVKTFSSMKLNRMTTAVHAKTSAVSRYIFALYSAVPMEFLGTPSTSAAIPAFHARPMPLLHAAIKYGITDGT